MQFAVHCSFKWSSPHSGSCRVVLEWSGGDSVQCSLQCFSAVVFSVLQLCAVFFCILQCFAVFCSVLLYFAEFFCILQLECFCISQCFAVVCTVLVQFTVLLIAVKGRVQSCTGVEWGWHLQSTVRSAAKSGSEKQSAVCSVQCTVRTIHTSVCWVILAV